MEPDKVLEELKDILVERLKFEPSRLPKLTLVTAAGPKGPGQREERMGGYVTVTGATDGATAAERLTRVEPGVCISTRKSYC